MWQIKPSKIEILIGVCESQNHRCAVCTERFPALNLYVIKSVTLQRVINDNRARGYHNSVAICPYCAGGLAEHRTVERLYEARLFPTPKPEKPPRPSYPENLALWRSLLIERGLDPSLVLDNPNIIYVNPRKLPEIAAKVREYHEAPVMVPVSSEHKKKVRSAGLRGLKKRLLVEQNYRCYYDGVEMELNDRRTARSYTVEHLIRVADGGTNSRNNIVLACRICNSMRERLNMSAPEFKKWAQENHHVIERLSELNIDATRSMILSLDSIQGPVA